MRSQTPTTSQCAEAHTLITRSWPNFCSHLKLLKCRRKKAISLFILSFSPTLAITIQKYSCTTLSNINNAIYLPSALQSASLICCKFTLFLFFVYLSKTYRGSSKNTALSCFTGLFYRIENCSSIFFPSL